MTPDQVALAYWAAEERRDLDAVMAHFHDDAVFFTPDRTWVGAEDIRDRYASMIDDYPGLHVDVGWVIVDTVARRAALQWHSVLTDRCGEELILEGVNLVQTRNGRFTEIRCLFDPGPLR